MTECHINYTTSTVFYMGVCFTVNTLIHVMVSSFFQNFMTERGCSDLAQFMLVKLKCMQVEIGT